MTVKVLKVDSGGFTIRVNAVLDLEPDALEAAIERLIGPHVVSQVEEGDESDREVEEGMSKALAHRRLVGKNLMGDV